MNDKLTQSGLCRLFCILLIYICLIYYTNDSMGASCYDLVDLHNEDRVSCLFKFFPNLNPK